jgi:hypothetical protein
VDLDSGGDVSSSEGLDPANEPSVGNDGAVVTPPGGTASRRPPTPALSGTEGVFLGIALVSVVRVIYEVTAGDGDWFDVALSGALVVGWLLIVWAMRRGRLKAAHTSEGR